MIEGKLEAKGSDEEADVRAIADVDLARAQIVQAKAAVDNP